MRSSQLLGDEQILRKPWTTLKKLADSSSTKDNLRTPHIEKATAEEGKVYHI